MELDFKLVTDEKEYPYELLLLADETTTAIKKYIFNSQVYVVIKKEQIIAAFCLSEVNRSSVELKNISVSEKLQNIGVGSSILTFIKQLVATKYRNIIVGTPDCAIRQIKFYERNGFQKYDARKNFFIDNYDVPIIENGIQLKDMVLLKFEIK